MFLKAAYTQDIFILYYPRSLLAHSMRICYLFPIRSRLGHPIQELVIFYTMQVGRLEGTKGWCIKRCVTIEEAMKMIDLT